jgi:hypothetical protein
MSEEKMNSEKQDEQKQNIQYHVSPELDYSYRDIANIFVGAGEVVLEFGNHHRSMPGHISISNRIVLSVASAYELQSKLQQGLMQAQQQMQMLMNQPKNVK